MLINYFKLNHFFFVFIFHVYITTDDIKMFVTTVDVKFFADDSELSFHFTVSQVIQLQIA